MLEWILVSILAVIIIILSGDNMMLRTSCPYYKPLKDAMKEIAKLQGDIEDRDKIITMQKNSLKQYNGELDD